MHNADLHENVQNIPILSRLFKERMVIKVQGNQEGFDPFSEDGGS